MRTADYTLITAHDQRDRAEMLDCAARHAFGMHWPVTGWTDTTTPRTDRPVTMFRTGPTPASQWGVCRVIRAARASFPHGPTA